MSISIEELNRMNPDSYQIIDIRDENGDRSRSDSGSSCCGNRGD